MSVIPVPFFSAALYARKLCFIYLPPGYEKSDRRFPVVYLLHGLYGNEADWIRRGRADRTLARMIAEGELRDCIAVMASDGGYGQGTFYTDWYDGTGNFEQYITDDLVPFIDEHFRTIPERAWRFVAGLSMGGFGAVFLAMRRPDLFGSCASIAGALGSPSELPYKDFERSEFPRMFGPAGGAFARERDLLRLMKARLEEGQGPALYFDCGLEDSLLPINRAFRQHVENMGYPHDYREFEGGHNFDYFGLHLEDALKFADRHFASVEEPV